MEDLDRAISILMKLIFKPADRREIDEDIRQAIHYLEDYRERLKHEQSSGL